MKATPHNTGRLSVPVAITIAVFTLALTVVSLQRAYAVTTVPNALRYSFTVAASSTTGNYGWPQSEYPIFMSGTGRSVGWRGTGQMAVTYTSVSPAMVTWAGVNSDNGNGLPGVAVSGWTTGSGVKMLEIGYNNSLQIETGSTGPNRWRVRNNNTSARACTILEIY